MKRNEENEEKIYYVHFLKNCPQSKTVTKDIVTITKLTIVVQTALRFKFGGIFSQKQYLK